MCLGRFCCGDGAVWSFSQAETCERKEKPRHSSCVPCVNLSYMAHKMFLKILNLVASSSKAFLENVNTEFDAGRLSPVILFLLQYCVFVHFEGETPRVTIEETFLLSFENSGAIFMFLFMLIFPYLLVFDYVL